MKDEKPVKAEEHNLEEQKPTKRHDGQGTDEAPDRAQPELTEENLLTEKHRETRSPQKRDALEDELEEMEGEIREANDK